MKIIWAQDDSYSGGGIFLAGPTLRSDQDNRRTVSWRLEAIEILSQLDYQGELYVPEPEGCKPFSSSGLDHEQQIAWERMALRASSVIAFWIPRDLEILPGFTTNVEFGEWSGSGKCVLGHPPLAPKLGYLEYVAFEKGIPICLSLTTTMKQAKEMHHETHHHRP